LAIFDIVAPITGLFINIERQPGRTTERQQTLNGASHYVATIIINS
jgi:hypothetical protein